MVAGGRERREGERGERGRGREGERERGRERERERGREEDMERGRERVCVCVRERERERSVPTPKGMSRSSMWCKADASAQHPAVVLVAYRSNLRNTRSIRNWGGCPYQDNTEGSEY